MTPIEFIPTLALDYELRQRALREGRTLGEIVLRAVTRGIATMPALDSPEAAVDKVERKIGRTSVAVYLSKALATAVRKLATAQDRSASWIVRDLLRTELRRRGILPTPADQPSNSAAS